MTGRVWATWVYRMMGLVRDGGCAEEMAIYLIADTVGRERGREGRNERTNERSKANSRDKRSDYLQTN